jgi:hypothetical protein
VFTLLPVYSILLWLVMPLGTLVWLFTLQILRTPAVSLGAYLGWISNNVAFVMVRSLWRPFFPTATVAWIPASDRAAVTHLRFSDLF